MPHAQLTVVLPTEHWCGDFSRTYPDSTIWILSAVKNDKCGLHLDIRGDAATAPLSELRDYPVVCDIELVLQYENEMMCLIEVETAPIMAATFDSLTPVKFPVKIHDGTASVEIIATNDRLAVLNDHLDASGLSWTIDWLYQSAAIKPVLTASQRRAVQTALDRGYYEIPRKCTLTELADELGIAKSSCSERLHRAESKIIQYFFRVQNSSPHYLLKQDAPSDATHRPPYPH